MVRSTPIHQTVIRERRSGFGVIRLFFFLIVVFFAVAVLAIAFVWPAKLAIIHERTLSIVHGGVVSSRENTIVDCILIDGFEGPQAVSRTVRTTTFRDGTSLSVTFNSRPSPMNCSPQQVAP